MCILLVQCLNNKSLYSLPREMNDAVCGVENNAVTTFNLKIKTHLHHRLIKIAQNQSLALMTICQKSSRFFC